MNTHSEEGGSGEVWTKAACMGAPPPPPLLSGGLHREARGCWGEGRVKTVNRAGCSHCFPAANRDRLFLTE